MVISKYTTNLYQSEVYRELERQAVKKGYFKPTETELVKVAAQSIKEEIPLDPSDDIFQDIACLASALRQKGFTAQAEDVEKNLLMYKKAESEFYNVTQETNADILQFAHRDGDVNVFNEFGDLGSFKTLQSISDKIQAVVRKEPTGVNKLASFTEVLYKAAQAKDPNLYSSDFQTGDATPITGPVPTADTVAPASDAPKTRKGIIDLATNTIATVENSIKAPPSLDNLLFSDLKGTLQRTAYVYFAKLSGVSVNEQAVEAWYRVVDVARAEGVLTEGSVPVISAEVLYTKLQGSGNIIPIAQIDSLKKIANAIGLLAVFNSTFLNENNEQNYIFAGGLGIATNNTKAMAACTWLAQQIKNIYVAAFGESNEKISQTTAAMKSIPENFYKNLQNIKLTDKFTDTNSALLQLVRLGKDLSASLTTFMKEPSFSQMRHVNTGVIDGIVSWAKTMINSVTSQYKSLSSADQMQVIKVDTTGLENALNYWESQAQSGDVDVAKRAGSIVNKITRLKETIDDHANKPWIELQDALSDLGIDAPNKNVFLASVKQIEDSAKGRK